VRSEKCEGGLTIWAISKTEPKWVGNFSLSTKSFVNGKRQLLLERCLQMQILSGEPSDCGWTSTMSGEDWKGPFKMSSASSWEKGPLILLEETSSSK
jgi:hypothetical protein